MADRKISELATLTGSNAAEVDYVPIVDVSEPSNADRNKRIQLDELIKFIFPQTVTTFTPNLTAGTATFNNETGHYWRLGNFMFFQFRADVTANGSLDLIFDVPDSLTINTSLVLETLGVTINDHFLGAGKWLDGGIYRHAHPVYFNTTQLKFSYEGGGALIGNVLANGDRLNLNGLIPILEWT